MPEWDQWDSEALEQFIPWFENDHFLQHLFHPPVALPDWPGADRRSRLVVITRGLPVENLLRALESLSPRLYVRTEDRPGSPARSA